MEQKNAVAKLIPVMLAFFTMGFVDLVGIATNYIKGDFGLSDTESNAFSVMVFLWFLLLSVPTGMLMNKIGRRRTVLISLVITFIGLCIPFLLYNKATVIVFFSLIGIGNTVMQVSLNPLLTNLVSNKKLASSLTMGQFVKAIASFIAPVIAVQAALRTGDWKLLFPVFAMICLISVIYLSLTKIKEHPVEGRPSTFSECFSLLGHKMILFSFLGILVHVGIDVGINITAPKLLIERVGMNLSDAGYATSIYFLFRTLGCFSGTFILARVASEKFFIISVATIFLGVAGLFFSDSLIPIYICVALIGLGNSNVFPVILSKALMLVPARGNEISGLMMMGIFGGAIFPVLMGVASDSFGGQIGAVTILTACVIYLIFLAGRFKTELQYGKN